MSPTRSFCLPVSKLFLSLEPPEKSLTELAQTSYEGTLSQHHPWPVRQAVGVAFHALPYREVFVKTLIGKQPPETHLNDEMACRDYLVRMTLPALRKAYQVTQEIFASAGMLNLP